VDSTENNLPDFLLRLSTRKALCHNMAAQKVHTSEAFPALNRVMPNAPLERLEDFRLPSLAHSVVLVGLNLGAEIVVQANKNVLDSDDGTPRR
jgi:hypothetical protein